MPEYLAPAVYVEEVDTGTKPIEGVSTSTAGMIGVTERGPANVPTLVTSNAEFQRIFGQTLSAGGYGEYRYLPHAVEGFFTNGGKRVYVTRIVASGAGPAERTLVAVDAAAPAATQAAVGAQANAAGVVVISATGLAAGDTVQIDSGAGAEFRTIGAPAAAQVVALDLPLAYGHAANVPNSVTRIPALGNAGGGAAYNSTLTQATAAGADTVTVVSATPPSALAAGQVLRIGAVGADDEYVLVGGAAVGTTIPLAAPLQRPHAANSPVVRQGAPAAATVQTQLPGASSPGATLLVVASNAGLTTDGDFLRFLDANATHVEIRRVGTPTLVGLTQGSYAEYAAGTAVERVTLPGPGANIDLTSDAEIGATTIQVSDRTTFAAGDIVQIGIGPDLERIEVAGLPGPVLPPNPGALVLRAGLRVRHAAAAGIVRRVAPATAVTKEAAVAVDTAAGVTGLILTSGNGVAAGDILRITPAAGGPFYHEVAAAPPPIAVSPQTIPVAPNLVLPHAAGSAVVVRQPMALVRALDAGAWGNRLRVAMEAHAEPLLATTIRLPVSATSLKLMSTAGVEPGTELVVTDALNTETTVKVAGIDYQNDALVTLEASTPVVGLAPGDRVRSREYRFVVELMRQPDPANPSRNNVAIDRESFSRLSLDPRHSRYFQSVIGATWDMLTPGTTDDDAPPPLRRALRRADRRSEGESSYVRIQDLAPSNGLRQQPVATYTQVPGGAPRLVLLPLAHGDDSLAAPFGDGDYIGLPDVNPERNTGLHSLRTIEEISIIAAPGRTSLAIQNALINHCELMRYRFAVLDGQSPPSDSMSDIQFQRQQFDTKYAALYHPWLVIPDPYPIGAPADYPIPPSGHMVGIYARTDIERGVHKAPANEVVRGVVGLQRVLNKEQHDILNPYPVNINVIRDFRPNNRGIRVYGGRVITSDSDWKYVNVRRLLIFIEASIDRGLQWVVFEPNAEPLWARVRRAISNFLTLVWRNGALEGTKPEEAYFVKCDRTTMTQTDIDQGRLIVLVGVAPVKPAEFVIVRIGLWTAHADD
jgi:phage tail sheath protein FI